MAASMILTHCVECLRSENAVFRTWGEVLTRICIVVIPAGCTADEAAQHGLLPLQAGPPDTAAHILEQA
jgi:hypothetical protein